MKQLELNAIYMFRVNHFGQANYNTIICTKTEEIFLHSNASELLENIMIIEGVNHEHLTVWNLSKSPPSRKVLQTMKSIIIEIVLRIVSETYAQLDLNCRMLCRCKVKR